MNQSPPWKFSFRNFTPALIYKTLWFHYLVFHTFFSSSALLPQPYLWIIFITGVFAILLHRWDKNQYLMCFHKLLFVALNIYPLAIDNRVTVAIFESSVFVLVMLRSRAYESLRKPYRIILSLVFFFAAFHKLNSTHLFAAGSCSRVLTERLLPFPSMVLEAAPFVIVIAEFYLSYLFARARLLPIVPLLLFSLPFSALGFHQFIAILWVLACPLSFPEVRPVSQRWIAALTVLFSLNALAPYLGLKNGGAMNMYSNLVVEKGSTNHYLFPRSIPGNLEDTVRIIRTNHPYLLPETTIPRKYLQSILRYSVEHGYRTEVTIEHERVIKELLTERDRVEFIQGLSTFEYYFLSFSGIPRDPNQCQW